MFKINIAIDGYSSCGKGTLASMLAKSLGYTMIDTGAMYRAVTLYLMQHEIELNDLNAIEAALPYIHIAWRTIDHKQNTFLNGINVEDQIRSMAVANMVSPVSQIAVIRAFLVEQQQALGQLKGVVMDGRDIGTVVFPDAEVKFFMTASAEVRAQRRYSELQQKGQSSLSFEQVLENLNERDYLDTHRSHSPLIQAPDAIVIDNSHLTIQAQLDLALEIVQTKINNL
jgi:cytidylate kinase